MSLLCTAQTETLETLTNTVSQCFVRGSPPSGKVVSHEPPPPYPSEFPMIFRGGWGGMDIFWNHTIQHIFQYIPKCVTDMFLAWNVPLKLSSSTIFRGAESLTSDHVMFPNKLFSCDCNFYATLLKDKSPVYHVFSKAGC